MSSSVPAKIVMKGTSQMSLHDRFTRLPAKAALPTTAAPEPKVRRQSLGSSLNTRNMQLARDMERRPNVMAALKEKKKQNVMQRLGAKARLGYAMGGGRWPNDLRAAYSYSDNYWNFGRRGRGRGWRGGRNFYNRRNYYSEEDYFSNSFNNTVRMRGGNSRGFSYGRRGGRGRGGWGRGGRGGGRGGRGGGFRNRLQRVNKDDLDKELDDYMAKNRGQLDDELDSYMNQVMAS